MPTRERRWSLRVQADPIGLHSWAMIAGLSMLHATGEAKVVYGDVGAPIGPGMWFEARDVRRGATKTIHVDCADAAGAWSVQRTTLADSTWKRSWRRGLPGRPLGLVAGLRSGSEPIVRYTASAAWISVRRRRVDLAKRTASIIRQRPFPPTMAQFERRTPKQPYVLYQVRAWGPGDTGDDTVNDGRAAVVAALREHFGPRFKGGFTRSEFARRRYPKLLTEQPQSSGDYAALVRAAAVGVSTVGLHGSNPWKLAEYLAGGVAIVSEPLKFELPDSLEGVVDWFTTPAECVAACEALLDNDAYLARRELSERYWRENARPDVLLRRRLSEEFAGT
jgi:hypothetical protein